MKGPKFFMWRKNQDSRTSSQHPISVIDHGCEVEGQITFTGTLVLKGKLTGEIRSGDTLIVGETGDLQAEVSVSHAILDGQLSGNITVHERIELRKTSRVFGNISTPLVVIEEGAILEGQCKINGQKLEPSGRDQRGTEIHSSEKLVQTAKR